MKFTEDGLLAYAKAFNVPNEITIPLIRKMILWSECSGSEWATSHCKDIKLDVIRVKAGLQPASDHVAHNGIFKSIVSFGQKHRKNFSKVIGLLQVYTTLYSPCITAKQERKFLSGVMSGHFRTPDHYHELLKEGVRKSSIHRRWVSDPQPYALMPTSDSKNCPLVDGHSYVESENHLNGLLFLTQTRTGVSVVKDFPDLIGPLMSGIEPIKLDGGSPLFIDTVGRIGLIQEPGYKLRAVANPGRVYQRLLEPLGDSIYSLLKELPWDCTHNQFKPFPAIQKRLKQGDMCYSVDLAGATDYFPLDLQMSALRSIFIRKDYLDLFERLCTSQWFYTGTDGNRSVISWDRGQPLGLYPSFGTFALTHGLLLFSLNNFKHEDAFFVLGDDVVILDPTLHSKYLEFLDRTKCPFSESKTIASSQLCEFAGRIITSNDVITQPKWRSISDDNFIDILRSLGPRVMRLLKPRQRAIARKLWVIPEFLGGVGFNPDGLPLSERYFMYLSYKKEISKSYLMSYNESINRHNYCGGLKYSFTPDSFRISSNDFDQKSIALLLSYLPTFVYMYEVMGNNLFNVNDDLPLMISGMKSRKTRLEQLETLFA